MRHMLNRPSYKPAELEWKDCTHQRFSRTTWKKGCESDCQLIDIVVLRVRFTLWLNYEIELIHIENICRCVFHLYDRVFVESTEDGWQTHDDVNKLTRNILEELRLIKGSCPRKIRRNKSQKNIQWVWFSPREVYIKI